MRPKCVSIVSLCLLSTFAFAFFASAQTESSRQQFVANTNTAIKQYGVAAPSATQGPFGLEKGMTREQVIRLVGQDAVKHDSKDPSYILVLTDAPKPHSAFQEYVLFFSPKAGLLKVVAVGKIIDCDAYGSDLKMAFADAVKGVSTKYGPPSKTLDSPTTDLFKDPSQWMMGLYDKDRVLESFWDLVPPVNNVSDISVEAKAVRSNRGYVKFAAEFTGWEQFVDERQAKQDESF